MNNNNVIPWKVVIIAGTILFILIILIIVLVTTKNKQSASVSAVASPTPTISNQLDPNSVTLNTKTSIVTPIPNTSSAPSNIKTWSGVVQSDTYSVCAPQIKFSYPAAFAVNQAINTDLAVGAVTLTATNNTKPSVTIQALVLNNVQPCNYYVSAGQLFADLRGNLQLAQTNNNISNLVISDPVIKTINQATTIKWTEKYTQTGIDGTKVAVDQTNLIAQIANKKTIIISAPASGFNQALFDQVTGSLEIMD